MIACLSSGLHVDVRACVRYVKRRAKEEFHTHSAEADAGKVQQFWTRAQSELELVRRQAMVYTLFARKHKSIMVGDACAYLCLWSLQALPGWLPTLLPVGVQIP